MTDALIKHLETQLATTRQEILWQAHKILGLQEKLIEANDLLLKSNDERDRLLDRLHDSNQWKATYLRDLEQLKAQLRELGRE